MKKVTIIIINTKNNSKLKKVIESVERQTYQNLEIILINYDEHKKDLMITLSKKYRNLLIFDGDNNSEGEIKDIVNSASNNSYKIKIDEDKILSKNAIERMVEGNV